jgi:branched-chain amino acid transport system ATP-binding protein
MGELLEVCELTAGYGGVACVRDVSMTVKRGSIVALLGANGAGKTTTVTTIAGVIPQQAGSITFRGEPLVGPLHRRARKGLALVTEQRSVFMSLTVLENLRLGRGQPDAAIDLFPELKDHLHRPVGLLSGGQQQMLTLGRAISSGADLLVADELSLGLAPMLVDRLLAAVQSAARAGMGILLIEQHVRKAMAVADHVYILQRGGIALEGPAAEMRNRIDEIEHAYLSAQLT